MWCGIVALVILSFIFHQMVMKFPSGIEEVLADAFVTISLAASSCRWNLDKSPHHLLIVTNSPRLPAPSSFPALLDDWLVLFATPALIYPFMSGTKYYMERAKSKTFLWEIISVLGFSTSVSWIKMNFKLENLLNASLLKIFFSLPL